MKAVSSGKYDQFSWIGKHNFEDKISVKCNVTFDEYQSIPLKLNGLNDEKAVMV
jgi:hypothetical protein